MLHYRVVPATRVFADGMPVLLQDSQAVCVPTGTGRLEAALVDLLEPVLGSETRP